MGPLLQDGVGPVAPAAASVGDGAADIGVPPVVGAPLVSPAEMDELRNTPLPNDDYFQKVLRTTHRCLYV